MSLWAFRGGFVEGFGSHKVEFLILIKSCGGIRLRVEVLSGF